MAPDYPKTQRIAIATLKSRLRRARRKSCGAASVHIPGSLFSFQTLFFFFHVSLLERPRIGFIKRASRVFATFPFPSSSDMYLLPPVPRNEAVRSLSHRPLDAVDQPPSASRPQRRSRSFAGFGSVLVADSGAFTRRPAVVGHERPEPCATPTRATNTAAAAIQPRHRLSPSDKENIPS